MTWQDDQKKVATGVTTKREWVGLTDEEIEECFVITPDQFLKRHIYKRIEAKLREKNTAIAVPKEEGLFPVQVSIEEFMMRAEQDPDLVGRPVIWTQWPNKKKDA